MTKTLSPFVGALFLTVLVATAHADDPSRSHQQAQGPETRLPRIPPTPPEKAVGTLRLQSGFRAELIAAEPLVTDPVAMQYDENGLAYVVEMNDYPYSDRSHDESWTEQSSEPIGRVRVLEDTDGDGRFDQSTVFADKLSWPSGIACWKGGVYVAATPDIWYLKDIDGDHRADIRRKVFTGFRKYNVQAVINNFQWGLDHYLYAAGSSNGGSVQSAAVPAARNQPIRLGRSDFRFHPVSEQFELVSGGARFGHTQDDWGNRFLCNIRNPVQHVVLPARYLRRNPTLPVQSAIHDVVESGDAIRVYPLSPPEPWRVIHARRLAADTTHPSPHDSTVPQGYVTSSSGVTIYRGGAYPQEFYGNAFVGEVAGNLVMRYKLSPDGVTFRGVRAYEETEFLASTDNWFRPVNFVNAPDGMLHVLDMYRETIEHPWSMPDDLKSQVDLTSGRDRGRIYRLVPPKLREGFQPPPPPRLGSAPTKRLVAELENPNAWWRETAHRLIYERQDVDAIAPLKKLLRETHFHPAKVHALWSLQGLEALTPGDLTAALADADEHVRTHAIRLAEPFLKTNSDLAQAVIEAASDPHIFVRFQAALSLGELGGESAAAALAAIARRDAADPWMRTAILTSLADSSTSFLVDVLADDTFSESPAGRQMIGQLSFAIAATNREEDIHEVLAAAVGRPAFEIVVGNVGAAFRRAGRDLTAFADDARYPIKPMIAKAKRLASSREAAERDRVHAIELIGNTDFATARTTLAPLVDARQPRAVQSAAIAALTGFRNQDVATILLKKYPELTPAVQAELIGRLLSRSDWLSAVLDAIEKGVVPATRISRVRQEIYRKSPSATIREKALRLFGEDSLGPRKEVLHRYQQTLTLRADRQRGKAVFLRECRNCHRLGAEGHDVGPNLATVRHRSPSQLLVNILDPNREVSPNFLEYIVATVDGRVFTGIIAAETPSSLTLRQAEGKQETILRDDIEQIRNTGKSLMPEGLEKNITPQEMADLISYLRG